MTGRISVDELRRLFRYEPETGHFIRLVSTSSNAKAGSVAGSKNKLGYVYIRIGCASYRANTLAWFFMTGQWPPGQVDHKNCNRADDRWGNLRLASHTENTANAQLRRDNKTGFKGVRLFHGRFQVRVGAGGKHHVGTFDTLDEARLAYIAAAKRLYGDFARAG